MNSRAAFPPALVIRWMLRSAPVIPGSPGISTSSRNCMAALAILVSSVSLATMSPCPVANIS